MIKKCPWCGNRDLVEIVYGMPTCETWRLVEQKKAWLGGCCVSDLNPQCHCFQCGRNVGSAPIVFGKRSGMINYRTDIVSLTYKRNGVQRYGCDEVAVRRTEKGYYVDAQPWKIDFKHMGVHRELSEDEWNHIIDRLYCKIYLHEWKSRYQNLECFVVDGVTYTLTVKLTHGRVRNYTWDSVSLPPYFKELEWTFVPFLKENKFELPEEP